MMKSAFLITLMVLLVGANVNAQTIPPVNARADVDAGGLTTVEWMAPFAADYFEDFEDGTAEGWVFDNPFNWNVENGNLTSFWQAYGGGESSWTSAYLGTDTYRDGIFELEFAKTSGNLHYAMSMFLFSEGHYPEGTENTYIFSITPGNTTGQFEGQFYVSKLIDGISYRLAGWRHTPVINNGEDAFNTLSVAYDDNSLVFYINGHEVFQTYESSSLPGYFGTGGAEDGSGFGHFGSIAWEYIAIDEYAGEAATSSGGTVRPNLPLALIDDIELARSPMLSSTQVELSIGSEPVLSAGFFNPENGSRELDEFLNYNVYRDGMLVGTPSTEMFSETLPEYGFVEYLVTAEYDEGESNADTARVLYKDPAGIVIEEDFNTGFPDGWTVDTDQPEISWHIDNGGEIGIFETPYMIVNDLASGGADLYERIETPEFDVSGVDLLILEFDHQFFDTNYQHGHIQYQRDDGNWASVRLFAYTMPDTAHAFWNLTEYIDGASTMRLGFLYNDNGEDGLYWGIDNVSVYLEGGGEPEPVTLTLTPIQTVIQPQGGTIEYGAHLVHHTGNTLQNVHYWTHATFENGEEYGPFNDITFTLQPFMNLLNNTLTLDVPANAPGGFYTFYGSVGYPNGPSVSDSFSILKLGLNPDGTEIDPSGWVSSGSLIAEESPSEVSADLPNGYLLGQAYPNPFNPSTTISVSLPETADLSVIVYNVTGQHVAELASGRINAGQHNFVFDGSRLASGLYFVRANVPGKLNSVQKIVLTK
jgi:Secretion system C-terminal sorting domain